MWSVAGTFHFPWLLIDDKRLFAVIFFLQNRRQKCGGRARRMRRRKEEEEGEEEEEEEEEEEGISQRPIRFASRESDLIRRGEISAFGPNLSVEGP